MMLDRDNQDHHKLVWEMMLRKWETMLPHEHELAYRKLVGSTSLKDASIHRPLSRLCL
jgi:hypothetical protein